MKRDAHLAVNRALRSGVLVPLNICEVCGCTPARRLDAHHYLGYDEVNWLVVQWLCQSCHGKAHGGFKQADVQSRLGHRRAIKMTTQERSAAGKLGSRVANVRRWQNASPEDRRRNALKGWETRRDQRK